jgi:DNA repair protein RecO (recombination protein O)
VLLPFQPVLVLLGKTPADEQQDIRLLRSAEWAGGQPLLAASAMFSGYYLNELLMKLLPRGEPQPVLFDAYADTLAALATEPDDSAALRAFELLLLRELGWLPALDEVTLTAAALQPDASYTLHEEGGLVPGRGPAGITWQAMEQALAHSSTVALRTLCGPEAAALRGPLRRLLHYHLGPAPLRTRQVWQGVQRLAQPAPESP